MAIGDQLSLAIFSIEACVQERISKEYHKGTHKIGEVETKGYKNAPQKHG